jgi:hypothetical protein
MMPFNGIAKGVCIFSGENLVQHTGALVLSLKGLELCGGIEGVRHHCLVDCLRRAACQALLTETHLPNPVAGQPAIPTLAVERMFDEDREPA